MEQICISIYTQQILILCFIKEIINHKAVANAFSSLISNSSDLFRSIWTLTHHIVIVMFPCLQGRTQPLVAIWWRGRWAGRPRRKQARMEKGRIRRYAQSGGGHQLASHQNLRWREHCRIWKGRRIGDRIQRIFQRSGFRRFHFHCVPWRENI